MTHRTHRIRVLRRWHARVGAVAALFLIFLVLSGLALNHSDALGLDRLEVKWPGLMAWYGLKAVCPPQGYPVGSSFFAWQRGKWTLRGARVASGSGEPVGAVEAARLVYVATSRGLYLYQPDGRLVDRMEGDALPGLPVTRLGRVGSRVALEAGGQSYTSADGLDWEKLASSAPVVWARLAPIPKAEQERLAPLFSPELSLERVLLDFHSGRIFGRYGPLAVDLLALALLALGLTGLWMYWRSVKR